MKKSEALDILGLTGNPGADEIKRAHRKKVIANHPDKFPVGSPEHERAEETTKRINEARDCLESGRWEPEFGGPRGATYTGYGTAGTSPYSGYTTVSWEEFIRNASVGGAGAQGRAGSGAGSGSSSWSGSGSGAGAGFDGGFVDFDFSSIPHVSYVYTSSSSGTRSNTGDANPFSGSSPFGGSGFESVIFDSIFGSRVKTQAERLRDAKDKLSRGIGFLTSALLITALIAVTGAINIALMLFYIMSTAALVVGREMTLSLVSRVAPVVLGLAVITSLIPPLWSVGTLIFLGIDGYLLWLCVQGILKTRKLVQKLSKA